MEDIISSDQKLDGDKSNLPDVSASVRENTDFMIGIKYLRYYPEKMFNSLQISQFTNHSFDMRSDW